MSKWNMKKIRDHHLGKVAYYTDEKSQRAMQRHQQMADALSDRIAADEASVPFAWCRAEDLPRMDKIRKSRTSEGALGLYVTATRDEDHTVAVYLTHPPAQPPIDLAAIREVIECMRRPMLPVKASSSSRYWEGYSDGMNDAADKLSRAIGGTP